jgi:hypothetical protein
MFYLVIKLSLHIYFICNANYQLTGRNFLSSPVFRTSYFDSNTFNNILLINKESTTLSIPLTIQCNNDC